MSCSSNVATLSKTETSLIVESRDGLTDRRSRPMNDELRCTIKNEAASLDSSECLLSISSILGQCNFGDVNPNDSAAGQNTGTVSTEKSKRLQRQKIEDVVLILKSRKLGGEKYLSDDTSPVAMSPASQSLSVSAVPDEQFSDCSNRKLVNSAFHQDDTSSMGCHNITISDTPASVLGYPSASGSDGQFSNLGNALTPQIISVCSLTKTAETQPCAEQLRLQNLKLPSETSVCVDQTRTSLDSYVLSSAPEAVSKHSVQTPGASYEKLSTDSVPNDYAFPHQTEQCQNLEMSESISVDTLESDKESQDTTANSPGAQLPEIAKACKGDQLTGNSQTVAQNQAKFKCLFPLCHGTFPTKDCLQKHLESFPHHNMKLVPVSASSNLSCAEACDVFLPKDLPAYERKCVLKELVKHLSHQEIKETVLPSILKQGTFKELLGVESSNLADISKCAALWDFMDSKTTHTATSRCKGTEVAALIEAFECFRTQVENKLTEMVYPSVVEEQQPIDNFGSGSSVPEEHGHQVQCSNSTAGATKLIQNSNRSNINMLGTTTEGSMFPSDSQQSLEEGNQDPIKQVLSESDTEHDELPPHSLFLPFRLVAGNFQRKLLPTSKNILEEGFSEFIEKCPLEASRRILTGMTSGKSFLSDYVMPAFYKKNYNAFLEFARKLASNLSLPSEKMGALWHDMGVELKQVMGINILPSLAALGTGWKQMTAQKDSTNAEEKRAAKRLREETMELRESPESGAGETQITKKGRWKECEGRQMQEVLTEDSKADSDQQPEGGAEKVNELGMPSQARGDLLMSAFDHPAMSSGVDRTPTSPLRSLVALSTMCSPLVAVSTPSAAHVKEDGQPIPTVTRATCTSDGLKQKEPSNTNMVSLSSSVTEASKAEVPLIHNACQGGALASAHTTASMALCSASKPALSTGIDNSAMKFRGTEITPISSALPIGMSVTPISSALPIGMSVTPGTTPPAATAMPVGVSVTTSTSPLPIGKSVRSRTGPLPIGTSVTSSATAMPVGMSVTPSSFELPAGVSTTSRIALLPIGVSVTPVTTALPFGMSVTPRSASMFTGVSVASSSRSVASISSSCTLTSMTPRRVTKSATTSATPSSVTTSILASAKCSSTKSASRSVTGSVSPSVTLRSNDTQGFTTCSSTKTTTNQTSNKATGLSSSGVSIKRKPGRPPKSASLNASGLTAYSNSPTKATTNQTSNKATDISSIGVSIKRKPGRPPKSANLNASGLTAYTNSPTKPTTNQTSNKATDIKRKPGRPPKSSSLTTSGFATACIPTKPTINQTSNKATDITTGVSIKRKPGRPPKPTSLTASGKLIGVSVTQITTALPVGMSVTSRTAPLPIGMSVTSRATAMPVVMSMIPSSFKLPAGVSTASRTAPLPIGVNVTPITTALPVGMSLASRTAPLPIGMNVTPITTALPVGMSLTSRTAPLPIGVSVTSRATAMPVVMSVTPRTAPLPTGMSVIPITTALPVGMSLTSRTAPPLPIAMCVIPSVTAMPVGVTMTTSSSPVPIGKTNTSRTTPLPIGMSVTSSATAMPVGVTMTTSSFPLPIGKTNTSRTTPLPIGMRVTSSATAVPVGMSVTPSSFELPARVSTASRNVPLPIGVSVTPSTTAVPFGMSVTPRSASVFTDVSVASSSGNVSIARSTIMSVTASSTRVMPGYAPSTTCTATSISSICTLATATLGSAPRPVTTHLIPGNASQFNSTSVTAIDTATSISSSCTLPSVTPGSALKSGTTSVTPKSAPKSVSTSVTAINNATSISSSCTLASMTPESAPRPVTTSVIIGSAPKTVSTSVTSGNTPYAISTNVRAINTATFISSSCTLTSMTPRRVTKSATTSVTPSSVTTSILASAKCSSTKSASRSVTGSVSPGMALRSNNTQGFTACSSTKQITNQASNKATGLSSSGVSIKRKPGRPPKSASLNASGLTAYTNSPTKPTTNQTSNKATDLNSTGANIKRKPGRPPKSTILNASGFTACSPTKATTNQTSNKATDLISTGVNIKRKPGRPPKSTSLNASGFTTCSPTKPTTNQTSNKATDVSSTGVSIRRKPGRPPKSTSLKASLAGGVTRKSCSSRVKSDCATRRRSTRICFKTITLRSGTKSIRASLTFGKRRSVTQRKSTRESWTRDGAHKSVSASVTCDSVVGPISGAPKVPEGVSVKSDCQPISSDTLDTNSKRATPTLESPLSRMYATPVKTAASATITTSAGGSKTSASVSEGVNVGRDLRSKSSGCTLGSDPESTTPLLESPLSKSFAAPVKTAALPTTPAGGLRTPANAPRAQQSTGAANAATQKSLYLISIDKIPPPLRQSLGLRTDSAEGSTGAASPADSKDGSKNVLLLVSKAADNSSAAIQVVNIVHGNTSTAQAQSMMLLAGKKSTDPAVGSIASQTSGTAAATTTTTTTTTMMSTTCSAASGAAHAVKPVSGARPSASSTSTARVNSPIRSSVSGKPNFATGVGAVPAGVPVRVVRKLGETRGLNPAVPHDSSAKKKIIRRTLLAPSLCLKRRRGGMRGIRRGRPLKISTLIACVPIDSPEESLRALCTDSERPALPVPRLAAVKSEPVQLLTSSMSTAGSQSPALPVSCQASDRSEVSPLTGMITKPPAAQLLNPISHTDLQSPAIPVSCQASGGSEVITVSDMITKPPAAQLRNPILHTDSQSTASPVSGQGSDKAEVDPFVDVITKPPVNQPLASSILCADCRSTALPASCLAAGKSDVTPPVRDHNAPEPRVSISNSASEDVLPGTGGATARILSDTTEEESSRLPPVDSDGALALPSVAIVTETKSRHDDSPVLRGTLNSCSSAEERPIPADPSLGLSSDTSSRQCCEDSDGATALDTVHAAAQTASHPVESLERSLNVIGSSTDGQVITDTTRAFPDNRAALCHVEEERTPKSPKTSRKRRKETTFTQRSKTRIVYVPDEMVALTSHHVSPSCRGSGDVENGKRKKEN